MLSRTQASFIRDSLTRQTSPLRSDGRRLDAVRPLAAQLDLVESANGSVRVAWGDSIECVVAIKAEVRLLGDIKNCHYQASVDTYLFHAQNLIVLTMARSPSISVSHKDDDMFSTSLVQSLQTLLEQLPSDGLRLSGSKGWYLYVDAVVLHCAPGENPLGALALATRLALRTARLPQSSLASIQIEQRNLSTGEGTKSTDQEDFEIDDDWANARPIQGAQTHASIVVICACVGKSHIIDPSAEEISVSDITLAVGFDPSITPVFTRFIQSNSDRSSRKGIAPDHYIKLVETASAAARDLFHASEEQVLGRDYLYQNNGFFDILL